MHRIKYKNKISKDGNIKSEITMKLEDFFEW